MDISHIKFNVLLNITWVFGDILSIHSSKLKLNMYRTDNPFDLRPFTPPLCLIDDE